MSNENDIAYTEAKELHESTATQFHISPQGELIALYFGEENFEMQPDGSVQVSDIEYDTKVKLTVEGTQALRNLLNDVLVADESEDEDGRGVH